jgi:phenylpropionate dioxygenase-like ring-hydroxylating dioxygenase large terminal subunit
MCADTYPTLERAGLVWAYLGDVDAFPRPPLPMMPEMSDDSYVWAVSETIWNANWLLVHDNTCDPAHVPYLHGHFLSHLRGDGIELEKLPDGNPIVTLEGFGVLVADDLVATTTEDQVLVHRRTADGDHSETFDGVEFTLPCVASVWVPVPDGGSPVRLHQHELPVDEERTVVYAWAGRAVPPEKADETRAMLQEFFVPATLGVFDDDSWITANQPDVDEAWATESLLSFDVGPPQVRRLIHSAYEKQQRRLPEDRTGAPTPG